MGARMRRSLLGKYIALMAGLIGTTLLASGAVAAHLAWREALAAAHAAQEAQARRLARDAARFVAVVRDSLQASAEKFDGAAAAGPEALGVELASLLRRHPEVADVRWIGADGHERLALARYGLAGPEPGEAAAAAIAAVRRERSAVGAMYFRKGSEPHLPVAAAAGPGGGVLLAELNLKPLSELVARDARPEAGTAYVVDRQGGLVAHADLGLVLANTRLNALPQVRRALSDAAATGAGDGRARDGGAVLAVAVPVEALPWVVLVERPEREALRPVWASVRRSLVLLAAGLVMAVAASVLLARRMVRPIRAIEAGAQRLAEGHFDERIALPTGDELEQLAGRFNTMAERLQEIHATQEARIAQRTEQLAQANAAMTRFLATAAHDLRQPVHALGLFAGELGAAARGGPVEPMAANVVRSAQHLESLVESLLDLSRLDVGAVRAEPRSFALQELLDHLALHFAPIAAAQGLRLEVLPSPVRLHTDLQLLERMLTNLVSNALRYTARGGVRVACRRRGEGAAEIVVVDTGIGIAADDQARVFDEFYRTEAGRQRLGDGLGLGLALVRRLAELLGLPLRLRSRPGRGTCVGIAVAPLADAALPGTVLPQTQEPLQGCRVLVVDDDAAVRAAVHTTLAGWGCAVATAAGADEALAHAARQPPSVVLCDLRLAGGECGLVLLERLEAMVGPSLRSAVMTGASDPQRLEAVRTSGRPLVFKPLGPARLRALVQGLAERG